MSSTEFFNIGLSGQYNLRRITCDSKGVYCSQYDEQKIIIGLRDNTIKIWDRSSLNFSKV